MKTKIFFAICVLYLTNCCEQNRFCDPISYSGKICYSIYMNNKSYIKNENIRVFIKMENKYADIEIPKYFSMNEDSIFSDMYLFIYKKNKLNNYEYYYYEKELSDFILLPNEKRLFSWGETEILYMTIKDLPTGKYKVYCKFRISKYTKLNDIESNWLFFEIND